VIKLVKLPGEFVSFAEGFRDLFTKPSYGSFCHMLGAVAVCDESKNVENLCETLAADIDDKKGRSSYGWFFNHAKWDEDEVAQRKADMFFEASNLKKGGWILLIIDDTYKEKKGMHTAGVGRFYDHSKGHIWGNSFVTSVLQFKGLFIPHKAKMYLKEEDAASEGLDFKTKPEIAFDDIIKPLKIPELSELMVVFDSWWFSVNLINKTLGLGHQLTCQIKSDKLIIPENSSSIQVQEYDKEFKTEDQEKVKINVRGKKKKYKVIERIVELKDIGKVKLIISRGKQKQKPKYYICTDIKLSAADILSIYEDRWNIETGHRESNQKLGFKDYQMRDKEAIERFIQIVFSVWTALLLIELENETEKDKPKTIGKMVKQIKTSSTIDMIKEILDHFNLPNLEKGLLKKIQKMGYKT